MAFGTDLLYKKALSRLSYLLNTVVVKQILSCFGNIFKA